MDLNYNLMQALRSLLPAMNIERWNQGKKPVAGIAAADHVATLESVALARRVCLADFILFGEREAIESAAGKAQVSLKGLEIVSCKSHEEAALTAADAAAAGDIQVLMKGAVHTSDFTRAFLDKSRKLVPDGALTSHVALVKPVWYHKPIMITDSALNIAPELEKKETILRNALIILHALGIEKPKVACIAPVETVTKKIQSTVDAEFITAAQRTESRYGRCIIEGPLALDCALSAEAAEIKGVVGEVPGEPDLLLMPNLDASNALYKSFILQPGTLAAGVIAGLRIPVVLTSRSDSEVTRFLSLAMALMVSRS